LDKFEYESLYRNYIARAKAKYPPLEPREDLALARRWRDHKDELARNRLVEAHLWIVPPVARKAAWKYYPPYDGEALKELIAAGNDGLMFAVERFDSDRGAKFSTAASWLVRKEIWRQAKRDRSSVSRPYDVKFDRDVAFDGLRGSGDREIEISPSGVQERRLLCIEPNDDGDTPQGSSFSRLLSDGLARLKEPNEHTDDARHAKLERGEVLCGRLHDLQSLLHAKAD
jgi:hypothetical protein